MKKLILVIAASILSLAIFAQELAHETLVVNIEVPVRVLKGNRFVDNLTINDFEVFEDGKLQKIEAVYLIKKSSIERREEKKRFTPEVSRNFVLVFEITDYLPKVREALDYFFDKVILPGDTLKVVTPLKAYDFKSKAFEILTKEEVANQLKKKLRKDTVVGSSPYKSLLRDFHYINRLEMEPDLKVKMLLQICRQIRDLSYFDEKKLLNFADYLKNMEGQKYVFLFYQKELMPIPSGVDDLDLLILRKDISFDVEKVKQAFSDSSISSHFLFITRIPAGDPTGDMAIQPSATDRLDQSAEIFSAFREMAQATGGITDSSANLASAFQRAVDASENYYLLYYSPSNYRKDGKFRNIKVQVKNRNFRISHRAGYFAN